MAPIISVEEVVSKTSLTIMILIVMSTMSSQDLISSEKKETILSRKKYLQHDWFISPNSSSFKSSSEVIKHVPFHGLAPPTEGFVLPAQAEPCLCWLWLHFPNSSNKKALPIPSSWPASSLPLCGSLCYFCLVSSFFVNTGALYVVLFLAHQDFQIVAVPGFPHALLCYWWG